MKKCVFLDRDGVVNKPIKSGDIRRPPWKLSEVCLMDGIIEIIDNFKKIGYLVIIVTNQPDVSRERLSISRAVKINEQIFFLTRPTDIFTCFHDDSDECECRKPKPGLLLESQKQYDIDLKNSWMVGDRKKDIDAGKAAGCRTIFVDCDYNEEIPYADFTVNSIKEITEIIITND